MAGNVNPVSSTGLVATGVQWAVTRDCTRRKGYPLWRKGIQQITAPSELYSFLFITKKVTSHVTQWNYKFQLNTKCWMQISTEEDAAVKISLSNRKTVGHLLQLMCRATTSLTPQIDQCCQAAGPGLQVKCFDGRTNNRKSEWKDFNLSARRN